MLLKNVNSTLPLRSPQVIGVFGNDAADVSDGLAFDGSTGSLTPPFGFNIGTLTIGGGSGGGRNPYIVSPLEAIKARARQDGSRVLYVTDNSLLAQDVFTSVYPSPDVCLVFLKTWSREGADRIAFEADYDSTAVVNNVAARCPQRTVVITHSGGINTTPWATNPNVTAILAAHYPGQESGNSIVDVLYGDVNPSGRLPYTIAQQEADYNTQILNITGPEAEESWAWQVNFTEGQFIDYRHFDAKNITPLYEFGYGLSYTTFALENGLSVSRTSRGAISPFPPTINNNNNTSAGGNPALWTQLLNATTTVGNTGSIAGSTVVQLYVSLPQDAVPSGTPVRVLRGFEKIYLEPGARQTVSFPLTRRDVSSWDVESQNWRIPEGNISVHVGFSSRDLPYHTAVRVL